MSLTNAIYFQTWTEPSGANLLTHENRLPKRCKTDEGCRCNTKTWSNAGYRPSALYGFYGQQFDVLASAFDGKAMSYALIQAGFPQVADSGAYALFDGSASDGVSILPTGTEQTVGVLNLGQLLHPADFVVTHNGLGPAPPAETCPNHDLHPVPLHPLGWYGASVTACPNKWALREGAQVVPHRAVAGTIDVPTLGHVVLVSIYLDVDDMG